MLEKEISDRESQAPKAAWRPISQPLPRVALKLAFNLLRENLGLLFSWAEILSLTYVIVRSLELEFALGCSFWNLFAVRRCQCVRAFLFRLNTGIAAEVSETKEDKYALLSVDDKGGQLAASLSTTREGLNETFYIAG